MKKNKKIYYGWLVVGAGLLIAVIGLGLRLSFGVFIMSIENAFEVKGNYFWSFALCALWVLLSALFIALIRKTPAR